MNKWYILKGVKIALCIAVGILGLGYLTMFLWNWLVPSLFNGPYLTFIQALGLFILAKLLFGGFKGKSGCWDGRCENGSRSYYWKQRMDEKMTNLTPEEREKFRKHMSDRCRGGWGWNKSDVQNSDSEIK